MSAKINSTIQSTAGAIPLKNEKGELIMQKVKVNRYVSGKRPEYAPQESSDEEEGEFNFGKNKKAVGLPQVRTEAEKEDRRLKRLQDRHRDDEDEDDEDDRVSRHRRRIQEPEVIAAGSDEEHDEEVEEEEDRRKEQDMEESSEEEDLDDEEIERRRALIRQRAKQQKEEEELMKVEEEKSEGESESESSEYEEYTDSEDEDTGPRLKPVFVRKKDRVTIQERENEEERKKELEVETKRLTEERKRQTLKMVEDEARKELEEEKGVADACDAVDTDDDNDEEEYEAWKVRELKRMKRDREEREAIEREKLELDRIHNMTEEERRAEQRLNPKQITNKANKGKYKFLQKYYHRGAFFLDEEDQVYTRDYSSPTLEDHFDKTILPKVMQVKNFGRSGRTKYTHLVDQDTTSFDSPWVSDTAQNLKFQTAKGGGMKQSFEKPSVKKRR